MDYEQLKRRKKRKMNRKKTVFYFVLYTCWKIWVVNCLFIHVLRFIDSTICYVCGWEKYESETRTIHIRADNNSNNEMPDYIGEFLFVFFHFLLFFFEFLLCIAKDYTFSRNPYIDEPIMKIIPIGVFFFPIFISYALISNSFLLFLFSFKTNW